MELLPVALVGLAVAAAGLALLERIIRSTPTGLTLAFAVSAVDAIAGLDIQLVVVGFTIKLLDVIAILLLVAAVARLLRDQRLTRPQAVVLLFLGIVFASLARGVMDFGPQSAVNESRRFVHVLSYMLYAVTVHPDEPHVSRAFLRGWLSLGAVIGAVALLRWGANVVGLSGYVLGDGDDIRVFPAVAAFVLAQAGIMATLLSDDERRLWRGLSLPTWAVTGMIVIAVALQHRTVWVTMLVAAAVWVVRYRGVRRGTTALLIVGLVLSAGLAFTVLENDNLNLAGQLEGLDETGQPALNPDTFSWRLDGWQSLLSDRLPPDPIELLVGEPFGTGWERQLSNGQVVDVSPHNFYIEAYLRTGLFGLGLLLLVTVQPILRLWRRSRDAGGPWPASSRLLVASMLPMYYIAYTLDEVHGLLIGLLVAGTMTRLPVGRDAGQSLSRRQELSARA